MRECRQIERRLSRLVDGELTPVEEQQTGAHLARCVACCQRLAEMQADRRLLAAAKEVAPPPYLLARVMAAVRRQQQTGRRALALVRLLQAAAAVMLVAASVGSGLLLGSGIAKMSLGHNRNAWDLLVENSESGAVDVYSAAIGGE